MLSDCFFPNLLTLVLCNPPITIDNNHIISIKSLRKCYFPFLSELIIDSNYISDIYPLYKIYSVHLQRLEISTFSPIPDNNILIDLRPIMKVNYPSLSELRMENIEVEKFIEEGEDEEGKPRLVRRKFINL